MKLHALTFLVCPACKHEFSLTIDRHEDSEVLTGTLTCQRCRATYPIIRGVPRFVTAESYATSFGRQWNWFRKVQIDSLSGTSDSERTLFATTGWDDHEYAGSVVLDAGVGAGRFAECAARKGAEVFGVDLSAAIDAAYLNIGRHPKVHLAQADIFALPFRPTAFDLAYAIGVLHHTPDPRVAFESVAATVKSGGKLAVYVYDRYGPGRRCPDVIRTVTTRLPARVVLALSAAAIPLYYVYRLPLVGKVLRFVCPVSMVSNWRWRWLDTFDWYTPTYQWKFLYPEVFRWFRENDFDNIKIFDGPIRMGGVKAKPIGAASDSGSVAPQDFPQAEPLIGLTAEAARDERAVPGTIAVS